MEKEWKPLWQQPQGVHEDGEQHGGDEAWRTALLVIPERKGTQQRAAG